MNIDHRLARIAAAQVACAAMLACGCACAFADSSHDIHYLAEHVPESGMDAHYQALPWPGGRLTHGRWQTSLDATASNSSTSLQQSPSRPKPNHCPWSKPTRRLTDFAQGE